MDHPFPPMRFRVAVPDGRLHPNGSNGPYVYGCYFPNTDLCVRDMGHRSTGKPTNVQWIDEEGQGGDPQIVVQQVLDRCDRVIALLEEKLSEERQ